MAFKEIANTQFAQTVVLKTSVGANNGIAELDENGKLKTAQQPAGIDEVIEIADFASLPVSGETSKIYITIDDGKTFRWGGTTYAEISASLALGETSATAYRGDRGKTAYDHSQAPHETVGAGAAAVASHESTYNHNNIHTHANKTYLDKISESGGSPTYDGSEVALVNNLAVKANGAEIATGTDDAKFATAKSLKDSGTVWISANAKMAYNGTDGCIDIEFV